METVTKINGVDVDQLHSTIEAIGDNADIARFCFSSSNRWIDGGHNQSRIDGFHGALEDHRRPRPFVVDKDEPPVLLGEDIGPNPVEYVLAGLAGCLTTSLVYHAAARGIQIDEVESSYEGDLDLRGFLGMSDQVRNGYEQIRVRFHVKADNATAEEIEELMQVARQRSPVFDIVSNQVPVSVELAD
jgi:uncharacterized OsmC-like protein